MKTYKNIYEKIYDYKNLLLAYKRARKHKTRKPDVIGFHKNYLLNIWHLSNELKSQTYTPRPLKKFIIKDPKTRVIHSSNFRDRIIHHDLMMFIESIFDKNFIYDSCANRVGKGNLFALKRFDEFKRMVSKNNIRECFVLKADIKHYFEEVNHEVLLNLVTEKIKDEKVIWLIKEILDNSTFGGETSFYKKGMPLGNLTSQFFANVYLNELDQFVKHILNVEYYIRYVDDFVILHESKDQLEIWRSKIEEFLKDKLKLELHPQKSRVIPLSRGVDFVGFRNFYHYRLLRKRNIQNIRRKIELFKQGLITKEKFLESFQGWNAYAKWANSYKLVGRFNGLLNNN